MGNEISSFQHLETTRTVAVTGAAIAGQMRVEVQGSFWFMLPRWAPGCSMCAARPVFSGVPGCSAASSSSSGGSPECSGVFLQCLCGGWAKVIGIRFKTDVLSFEVAGKPVSRPGTSLAYFWEEL